MYGEQNAPNISPLIPMATLGVGPYGHPLTSYAPVNPLAKPMILSTQSGLLSASGTTGSAFSSPVINNFRSPDSENSNSSISPQRDISETSSNSSSDSTPSTKGLDVNISSSKERKRKGRHTFNINI